MRPNFVSTIATMFCLHFVSAGLFAASMGSDSFAGAPAIGGNFAVELLTTTENFTTEAGEPVHVSSASGRSAWWKWTASANGFCTIETLRTDAFVNTGIAIYTGNALNSLTRVTANDNVPGAFISKVTFFATAGSTYRIAVDSLGLFDVAEVLVQLRFIIPQPLQIIGTWQSSAQDVVIGGNGLVQMSITATGAVTGYLIKGATRFPFKTQRTIDGFVLHSIAQPVSPSNPQGASITIAADLLFVGDPIFNPGSFSVVDGGAIQGIGTGSIVKSFSTANPAPQAGNYNVGLTFNSNTGLGFGIAKVSPMGVVRFAGLTGDGQPFAASSRVSTEGYVPIHQALQKGGGYLNGRFFTPSNGDSFSEASCRYRRGAVPASPFYPNGFVSDVTAAGARYVKPAAGQRAAGFLNASNGAGKLRTIDAPGELGVLTEMLTFSPANKFIFASAARKPALRLSVATGLVSGTITEPAGSPRVVRGLLSKDGFYNVRGFVSGKARTAGFVVEP